MLFSQPGESRTQSATDQVPSTEYRVPSTEYIAPGSEVAVPGNSDSAVAVGRPGAMVAVKRRSEIRFWEPFVVFLVTLAVLLFFTQRVVAYLTPTTGDEPFYLMTAISILRDGDLNECNNYAQHDEAQLYPSFYSFDGTRAYAAFPSDWVGWRGAPFPLPPHAGHIVPASRQCSDNYLTYPVDYNNPRGELYSKHGLGLSVLVLPAFALGGRLSVVFFLNVLGALLAVNIYLLAREGTRKVLPAILTWVAFAFHGAAAALFLFDIPGIACCAAYSVCVSTDKVDEEQSGADAGRGALRGGAAVVPLQVRARVGGACGLLFLQDRTFKERRAGSSGGCS